MTDQQQHRRSGAETITEGVSLGPFRLLDMHKWWDHGEFEGVDEDSMKSVYPFLHTPLRFVIESESRFRLKHGETEKIDDLLKRLEQITGSPKDQGGGEDGDALWLNRE